MADLDAPWFALTAQETRPIVMIGDVPIAIPYQELESLPGAAPVIEYVGKGIEGTWDDVWGWVKRGARNTARDAVNAVEAIVPQIEKYVESYVGQVQKALGGFINEVASFSVSGFNVLSEFTSLFEQVAIGEFDRLEVAVYAVLSDVANIVNVTVPWLESAIALVGANAITIAHEIGIDVEQWTVDHVYNPVLEDIYGLGVRVGTYVDDAISAAVSDVVGLIEQVNAETLAKIAALAAAVAVATEFVEECGEEMCSVQGPKTDLGKLFKAITLAGDVALLAEFLSLDKQGVEDRVHDVITELGSVIRDFDGFVTGGETVGGFLEKVASLA